MISKFKAAVVKFDVAFPYGEKHEEYGKVSIDTKDSSDLLVAEVGVKDFGHKDNSDLARRYEVEKEDFPVVLLFVQGQSKPYRFVAEKDEDFTAENIKRFIKAKSRVYLGLPGCVEQLDRIAEEFKTSSEKDRQVNQFFLLICSLNSFRTIKKQNRTKQKFLSKHTKWP